MTSTSQFESQVEALSQENARLRHREAELADLLAEIQRSKGWRFIEFIRRLRGPRAPTRAELATSSMGSYAASNPDEKRAELIGRLSALEDQVRLLEEHHTVGFWHSMDKIEDLAPSTKLHRCLICDHSDLKSGFEKLTSQCIFGGGRLERFKCPNCGCIFGADKFLELTDEMTNLDYRLLYSRYREGETAEFEKRTFRSLEPERGLRYVNWGAGAWNSTTDDLRSEGLDVWAYEPSAPAVSQFVVTDKSVLPSNVNGIFSHNVIEHFRRPVQQFREFHSLLAEGAKMAHSTPCYDYLYPFTRFHTIFYTGRSLEVLCERTGFQVVDRITDGEYMNVVFQKTTAPVEA